MPNPKVPSLIPAPPRTGPQKALPNTPSGPFDPLKVMVNDIGGSVLPFLRTQDDSVTRGVDMGMAGIPMLSGIGNMLRNYLSAAHGVEPALAHTVAQGFTQHIGEHLGIHPSLPAEFAPVGGEGAYNAARPAVPKTDPSAVGYQKVLSNLASTAKGNAKAALPPKQPATGQP